MTEPFAQQRRPDRLARVRKLWPRLSERGRFAVVIALPAQLILAPGLDLIALVAILRAVRRGWRVRGNGVVVVLATALERRLIPIVLLPVVERRAFRIAFRLIERAVERQPDELHR